MLSIAQQILARRREPEDERLLRLFWNRAELKREFGKLERERDRMVVQLRQQEGATLRVQQRLDQLEGLLADPLRAANAAVHYQLRGVWQQARRRLSRVARDLAVRQLEREHQREAARFEENREVALLAIEQRIAALDERHRGLNAELATLREQRGRLPGFWNHFRRRALGAREAVVLKSLEAVAEQRDRYDKACQEKAQESAAAADAIGVEGKRIVNLSLIALAQELLLHLLEHDVATLAREASRRTVGEMNYGALVECRELSGKIDMVLRRLDEQDDLPARVRRRTDYLRREANYKRDTDTVPAAGSVSAIPWSPPDDIGPDAGDETLHVNVLNDEYWDIYSVLLI